MNSIKQKPGKLYTNIIFSEWMGMKEGFYTFDKRVFRIFTLEYMKNDCILKSKMSQ